MDARFHWHGIFRYPVAPDVNLSNVAAGSFIGLSGEKGEEKRTDGKIVQPAGTVK